jgi:solute carrier family 25 carnitine/acylcarnitine transporter 20/29
MVGKSGDSESLITVKDFVAGTVAGVLQVLVGQPFDIIKVRIQAQSPVNPVYKNPLDCAKKIYTNEGLFTFYRGTLSPLVGIGACVSIQFGVNEACKRIVKKYRREKNTPDPNNLSLLTLASCGAVAGLVNAVVSIPVEHIRIKMQVEGTKLNKKYTGSYDCLMKIYNEHGIHGIYKGGAPTLPREAISYFFYFGMYEGFMQWSEKEHGDRNSIPLWKVMLFGGLAGIGEWVPGYPFDVIKSKYQADDINNPKYTSLKNCALDIHRTAGFKGFYSGLVPCLLRAPPANAATFAGFEICVRLWDKYFPEKKYVKKKERVQKF